MTNQKTTWKWVGIAAIIAIVAVLVLRPDTHEPVVEPDTTGEVVTYTDTDYGIAFDYPAAWGEVAILPGNKTCPEEDTYRTADTLSIYDREIAFPDVDLPDSESFITSGVRIYELDTENQNDCGDELLHTLASREFNGEAFSSFRLSAVDTADFFGYQNMNASRLNTEGREQFIFFPKYQIGRKTMIVQAYMSFIPYSGSPEYLEMEKDFAGDMYNYLEGGKTAQSIREYRHELRALSATLRKTTE